jgi:steroid delta-isomerase-like uncharacterized protein
MGDTHTSVVGPVPDRRQQVEQVIAAFNAHDAVAYASFYGQDAIVYDPAAPEPLHGRGAIRQDAEKVLTGMPDIMLDLEELFVDGPQAVMRLLSVGTHTGPMLMPTGEVPPTGHRTSIPMAIFSRVGEDGLIIEEHRYYDLMGMALQLGLI